MYVSFASQVFRFGRRTSSLLLKMQLWDYKLNLLRFPSADVVSSKSFLRFHKQLRIRLLSAALEPSFVRRNSSSRFQWPDLPRGRVFLGFRSWIVYLSHEKGKLFRWNAQLTWKENKKTKQKIVRFDCLFSCERMKFKFASFCFENKINFNCNQEGKELTQIVSWFLFKFFRSNLSFSRRHKLC